METVKVYYDESTNEIFNVRVYETLEYGFGCYPEFCHDSDFLISKVKWVEAVFNIASATHQFGIFEALENCQHIHCLGDL